ncbi:MAG TPA: methyltransferase domain-containing protein [Bryobacteraceae bacterium]|nr:methyltransferase domain-containing protein [Bryobacteraceae bacterium]
MLRSLEPELMDSPDLKGPVLDKFHRDLNFVHKCLGTFPTMERFIRKDERPLRSIIDVGCGGGALLEYLHQKLDVEVIGVDLNPPDMAKVKIIKADATLEPLPEADVAVCSLTAHHLTPEQNIELIRNVSRSCRRFLIQDLIRHRLPLVLFTIFLCPLIGHEAAEDGRQSIRRAFTPEEFANLVRTATAGTAATFTTDVSPFLSRQIIDIRFR